MPVLKLISENTDYARMNYAVMPSCAIHDERLTLRDCRILAAICGWRNTETGIINFPGREVLYEEHCGKPLPPSYMLNGIIEKLVGCGYLISVGYNKFALGIG
jgi:hypothetical protein